MSDFDHFVANKVNENNQPICPLSGCFEPIGEGKGDFARITPEAMSALFEADLIACEAMGVIVHKGMNCPDVHDWPLSTRIALLQTF